MAGPSFRLGGYVSGITRANWGYGGIIRRLGISTTGCNHISFSGSFLSYQYGMMK